MKQEVADSATSYGVGGAGLAIAHLTEIANVAQALIVIISCFIVAVRLIHDGLKLYRYWKHR